MRFLTIFVEKIHKHPQIRDVPVEQKRANRAKLNEIMPITETLKKKLLERYTREYEQYLKDKESERKRAVEDAKRRKQEEAKSKVKTPQQPAPASTATVNNHVSAPSAPSFGDLDDIVYPNDFPSSEPNKVPSPGLVKPDFDRALKPSVSFIEGGLRTVKIPHDTMKRFLEVARSNTNNNVETCGVLAGSLKQQQLIVTHVILPKQKGTSDSCNTMNEEEIFDIQDQLNLITLGWIHTHPSQTCFLSSVDLHTQAGYQIMMPEAIAIVCSPKHNEEGFFTLTSNGLEFISNCTQTGFHPHPDDQFVIAQHAVPDTLLKIEIVDLRKRWRREFFCLWRDTKVLWKIIEKKKRRIAKEKISPHSSEMESKVLFIQIKIFKKFYVSHWQKK